MKLIVTCEHAGNEIPALYQKIFQGADKILESHRGYDPGALDIFQEVKPLACFTNFQMVSRLLVEVNRSTHHPNLFSEFTTGLSFKEKQEILNKYYFPYREKVEDEVKKHLEQKEEVIHLSVHTFIPVLEGIVRNADVGILYDPSCSNEKLFSKKLKLELLKIAPELKIRYNYPYKGKSDGFTTYLRKKYSGAGYSGIELEVNQKFTDSNKAAQTVKSAIYEALKQACSN